jgi:DNA polymerase/3'-5' exonuclease PolX
LTNPENFTKTQLVGIELHNEFSIKIPRDEVENIAKMIKSQVLAYDKEALFEICGSYRRGRDLCGDIDIVLGTNDTNLLYKVVENCPFITHTFSLSGHKFIGVGKAHDLHRRIDMYSVKPHEYLFALLYFTGSANYNRLLRSAAAKKGLHLSNTSLTYQNTNKLALSPNNENDIIHFLNFPILALEERDI